MSEIINYVINIISYIMDVFYNIHITAEFIIFIGYWGTLCILVFIIDWIFNGKNILKKLLYITLIIMSIIYFILINITCHGEDDCSYVFDMTHPLSIKIHDYYSEDMYNYIDTLHNCTTIISKNSIHMSSREGWEIYFPREEDEDTYLDLLTADRDKINNIFQSNIPEMQNQNQRFTKTDLYLKFKDTIDTNSMKTWYKLDKTKYTRKGVLDVTNFEYLYRGIITTSVKNTDLNLNWWNLCYLYGISHHKDIPFDLNDVINKTPESFYGMLEEKKNNNTLNDYWKKELDKYSGKKNDFYAYMRIINFVVNKRNNT